MIQARINQGHVELQNPIPEAWEGRLVKILPLTPEDPQPDLEERLATLQKLGPMEFDPGEQELMEESLRDMDRLSRDAMQNMGDAKP